MAEAITTRDIRRAFEDFPGLKFPDSVTDPALRTVIRRKTAHVMFKRGIDTLPEVGTDLRDLIDDAVLGLAIIDIKRKLRPDEPDFLRALTEEQRLIERDLSIIEQSSGDSGYRFDVIGGAED